MIYYQFINRREEVRSIHPKTHTRSKTILPAHITNIFWHSQILVALSVKLTPEI